ncbi:LRR receptor-like serine threonine-protein kinase [Musa troglodytarum]|uniref:Receptor kinase-like protein Xa21 n=1 Tax=Musa troglodytarum TaxID=320322 RepID=A0A9E7G6E9_9LILI|nr:LRR receptor-like serine threonine-protein kinase [Musa troglodytarum]
MQSDLPSQKNTCMERTGLKCFMYTCVLWPFSVTLLHLMLLSSVGLSAASQMETPNADRLSLRAFKTLLSDPSGALASWDNASLHFCRWRGVTCRNHGGEPRVTALELESLQLELGFLSHLRTLNLRNNQLGGMIPTSLFLQNCSRLRIFSLSHNNLVGTIPRNLSNCWELEDIGLDNNMLEGEIPSDIASLTKLKTIVIWTNRLTGSIPPEIGNLRFLTTLILGDNHLNGTIPATLGNLSSLDYLDLSQNPLAGVIPATIWNLTSLDQLVLVHNSLTGVIPSDIGNLVRLTYLTLFENLLVGTIPETLGSLHKLEILFLGYNKLEARNAAGWRFLDALTNCSHLIIFDISANQLGGVLPKSIANLSKSLEMLHIQHNQIGGNIPTEIGNFMNLTEIDASSNRLHGIIPPTLGGLSRLERLNLSRNQFVREIPATIGNLSSLVELDLSGNYFVGEIPAILVKHPRLILLQLDDNQLHGSIPPSLGKCPLETLNLASNKLTGTTPKEIFYMPSLTKLFNISYNSLTGSLPFEIGNLKNTPTIDVSNNRLSGEIPSTIAECQVLQYLYMQGNLFRGPIPSFGQLKGLRVLDVSSNSLSGHIPDFLRSFNMTYLNLSFNDLDGEVPKDGIFGNASAFSVVGNSKLCGVFQNSDCHHNKSSSVKLIAITSVVGGILCVTFLISLLVARHRIRKSSRLSSVTSCVRDQHRKVSFAELLRATNEFSPANLIGMGSFGSVYKGIVDWEDHMIVAVKVLNLQQRGASRSFLAECEALRNIRHRNLVKVLTSCSAVDFRGNDFKALVFEFLPNGSLDKWLHPPERDEKGSLRMLSLLQRLNISIDVASALAYLHHHVPSPIVHCDLKPSNVLLDHDMVARVGDFGLARILNKIMSKSSQRSTNSATLKGSIGYAAPEYGMGNKVSIQGDVYSYGILLLEMFTGRRPTDDGFKAGLNLHQYVEMALPDQVADIMDPNLLLGTGEGEGHPANPSANRPNIRAVECVTSVLRVGILCSKESPKERRDMEDVIRELHDIRDAFLGLPLLE